MVQEKLSSEYSNSKSRIQSRFEIESKYLDGIVDNARWLSTLVLAEMAGLAWYVKLGNGQRLSIPLALVILLLSASLALFVLAVISARGRRRRAATISASYDKTLLAKIQEENDDPDLRTAAGERTAISFTEEALTTELSPASGIAFDPEVWGIAVFGLATMLAGYYVLSSEVWGAIGDLFQAIANIFSRFGRN